MVAFYKHVASHWQEAGSKLDTDAWKDMVKSITVHVDDTNPDVQVGERLRASCTSNVVTSVCINCRRLLSLH